jgi:hypothetical protein
MIRGGQYDKAEKYARDFYIRYTDVVPTWLPSGMDAGIEFFFVIPRLIADRPAQRLFCKSRWAFSLMVGLAW